MISIQLQNLHFKAFHGLYAEEKILGNIFEVNLAVKYQPEILPIISIEQTINYQNLFEIVERRMNVATELLETLVTFISNDIETAFPFIEQIEISITKKNPPIKGFNGNVAVSFEINKIKNNEKAFFNSCIINSKKHFCPGNISFA
jgi:dihydroneopterin aldolase